MRCSASRLTFLVFSVEERLQLENELMPEPRVHSCHVGAIIETPKLIAQLIWNQPFIIECEPLEGFPSLGVTSLEDRFSRTLPLQRDQLEAPDGEHVHEHERVATTARSPS